jgi:hypothetical protein
MTSNLFTTTRVRNLIRMAVASAIGSLVAWGATKWGKFNTGTFAVLAPAISAAYFAAIHWLEKKYPALGWLLGLLPGAKTSPAKKPVPPTPAPGLTPKPAAAKKVTGVKKAAAKKKPGLKPKN